MAGNRPGARRNSSTYWMSNDEWERMKEVLMCYALNIPVSLSFIGNHQPRKIRGFRTTDEEKTLLKTVFKCWKIGMVDAQIRDVLRANGIREPLAYHASDENS